METNGNSLLDKGAADFTRLLSAPTSTPGGGGASALCAALGAALGCMVGNITLRREKSEELIALTEEADALREELLLCVEKDAAAYEALEAALRLPKDDPRREEERERCLLAAAEVPLRMVELSCRGIALHQLFAEKGSASLAPDAATGAVLCWGAMYGAAVNVRANTTLMHDREKAAELNEKTDALMGRYWTIADETYEKIYQRLG